MIEKILSELQVLKEDAVDKWDGGASHRAYTKALEIVQEVAKEYGKDTNVRSNGWISCSERLPNNYEFVYATCISLVDSREPWVIECVYYKELGGFETASPMISWGEARVIAWMPRKFPAPYQKGE